MMKIMIVLFGVSKKVIINNTKSITNYNRGVASGMLTMTGAWFQSMIWLVCLVDGATNHDADPCGDVLLASTWHQHH